MLDVILGNAPAFLLIAARCLALIMTMPLFSMRSVSVVAKVSLAGYMTYILLPQVDFSAYGSFVSANSLFSMEFFFLLLGEALIGVITGFFISIIFSAFSTAGQFFAFQMGFSASEVYDALSQVENPLMGQYLNLIAMLVFLSSKYFQLLFAGGLVQSFNALNAYTIVTGNEMIARFFMKSLTNLFASALVISLPIMGTLCLITICTGILSKAAPQMNLLSEGFPVMMMTSFFILMALMPELIDFFIRSFDAGFTRLEQLFVILGGQL